MTMEQRLAKSVASSRFVMLLLGPFSILALGLAAVGIYGVMAYLVSQRTQEIGVRMALGAQKRDVHELVVGEGMALAVIGTAIGLVASLALTRLMRSLLFEVTPNDWLTFELDFLNQGSRGGHRRSSPATLPTKSASGAVIIPATILFSMLTHDCLNT